MVQTQNQEHSGGGGESGMGRWQPQLPRESKRISPQPPTSRKGKDRSVGLML